MRVVKGIHHLLPNGVVALVALTTWGITACSDVTLLPGKEGEWCIEPEPGTANPCEAGLTCVAGVCTSGGTADATDGGPTDTGADGTADTPQPDLPTVDLPPVDVPGPDLPQQELPDGDGGVPDVPVGDDGPDIPVADGDDDTSDVTVPDAQPDAEPDVPVGTAGLGEECNNNCETGLTCLEQQDGTRTCGYLPDGNCSPCTLPEDCPTPGSACNDPTGEGTFCSAPCVDGACALGFVCVDNFCRPSTGSCVCSANLIGFPLSCSNSTDDGTCNGQTVCISTGWTNCSAPVPIAEICDGKDNNCDGVTDEAPVYKELGNDLLVGAPCGLGLCTGGEVVCDGSGGVTCSSNVNAQLELCSDALDNDCDGFVNEGCVTDDFDGDGIDNANDCDPFDPAIYQGAPEPCCNPGDTNCDKNCDGSTTACAGCDTDFDGFCPPEDCNDSDPTVYPGAPEKCNDSIDQDCQGGDLLCPPGADVDNDGYIPPADCIEGNPAINPGATEICDNLDNDCDGVVDEGNPQAGMPCGTGAEYCQSGTFVCTHYSNGAVVQCQGAQLFSEELCDGIDNNCSGTTDETWPELGLPCDGPDSDACPFGVFECAPDGSGVICGQETQEDNVEVCNGIDDDCNGATDEFVCNINDLDGDGYTVAQGDCNDLLPEYRPGAQEGCCDPSLPAAEAQVVCDLNCDGLIIPCFMDNDFDGFTAAQGDCNDNDPTIYPGAPEKCGDGIDQDCANGDLGSCLNIDSDNDLYPDGDDCNPNNPLIYPGAPETCNYIDDDCDGVIDNGNPAGLTGPCGPDTPECTPGEWVCVHDAQTSTVQVLCINDKFQDQELCNGVDDDCDGETDETFTSLGKACDGVDSDSCENGITICTEDGSGTECGEEDPTDIVEVCDAFDNDCDGEIDNGLTYEQATGAIPLGDLCDGIGGCGTGVAVCALDGSVTCSTNPDGPFSQAQPEICNNIDDDCDGETDEDFTWQGIPKGEPCDGVGACGDGIVECGADGLATCSTNAEGSQSQSQPEVCDGQDNDCDGMIDEDLVLADSPCLKVGVCEIGPVQVACTDGEWFCDYTAVPSYEEEETLCDGLDNDCDGFFDEDQGLGEPCDGPDADECANGTATCAPDGNGTQCNNELVTDIVETCNGADDDCDGVVDNIPVDPVSEGCVTAGVCANTAEINVICNVGGGPNVCDYSEVPGWEPNETLCDLQDNDCDTLIDEGLTYFGIGLGEACTGQGVCGDGVVQCNVETGATICSTEGGGAQDQSSPEVCDGLDNDCDGLTDEDFLWNDIPLGNVCSPGGVCADGIVECTPDGSAAVCSTVVGGSEDQTYPEVCDGIDSDCDGSIDELEELDPLANSGCKFDGICNDPAQFVSCEGGVWQCNYTNLASYQAFENLCDDLDNDCDGQIDEGWPTKGQACDGEDLDQCATGTWTCSAGGGLECINETGIGSPEVCDGEDNDCDGLKDEGLAYKGLPLNTLCDGVGQCGLGFVQCNGQGQATCSTNPDGSQTQAVTELCDSLDNDCDGQIDNGVNWEGVPLGDACDGTGECGSGVVECSPVSAGQATCSTNPNGSAPQGVVETCDNLDNNCDGQVDENNPEGGLPCDSDGDGCLTGFQECQAEGVLACLADVPCAPNTLCYNPGEGQQQLCTCQGQICSTQHGNECTASGCSCNGGAACNVAGGQVCDPVNGCVVP